MVKVIEMEYQNKLLNPPIQLTNGTYQGHNYYVFNMGTHPCAYIELPKESKYYNVDFDYIPIYCHGGLSYSAGFLYTVSTIEEERYFIGWDYGHYGDFLGFDTDTLLFSGKKWTTMEIIDECIDVIRQLVKLEIGENVNETNS